MYAVYIYYVHINTHTHVGQRRKVSTSKDIYKNDFMSIESTLNVSKVSTFMVLNMFLENKMSKFGWNNVTLSFSVTQYLC